MNIALWAVLSCCLMQDAPATDAGRKLEELGAIVGDEASAAMVPLYPRVMQGDCIISYFREGLW